MTRFETQLHREAGWDVRVGVIGLAILFGCMALLPRDLFWFYFLPIAALWFRYLWVRNRRDEDLLRADLATSGRSSAPGAYACERGIRISDGTHHVVVLRDDADALLQIRDLRGRQ